MNPGTRVPDHDGRAARTWAESKLAPSLKADIQAWLPKVKPGGWLSGDDAVSLFQFILNRRRSKRRKRKIS